RGWSAIDLFREHWRGALIANFDVAEQQTSPEAAEGLLRDGRADAVSFARAILANPDFVARLRLGAPLHEAARASFYAGDHNGYTTAPTLTQAADTAAS